MRNDNFVCLKGWMIKKLGLSGVKLIIYAVIYGFSQDGVTEFSGGVPYLMEWTGASYKTVCSALKELTDMGVLIKTEVSGGTNRYRVRYKDATPEEDPKPDPKSEQKKQRPEVAEIVNYLNAKAGAKFKTGKDAASHINARLDEGYSVDDFKLVIDNMTAAWKNTDFERYLRPQTLFGNKFASYMLKTPKNGKNLQSAANYNLEQYNEKSRTQKLVYKRKAE